MFGMLLLADNPTFKFTEDPMVQMLLYFTIALVAVGIIVALLVKKFNKDKLYDFKKTSTGILLGYSLAVISIMMFMSFSKKSLGFLQGAKFVPLLFYPLLTVLLVAVVTGVLVWLVSLFKKEATKYVLIAGGIGEIGAFVALMVCMTKFYDAIKNDPAYASESWMDFSTVSTTGLICTGILFMIVIAVIFLLGKKRKDLDNTRALVYGAISIAMSFALSYIRFFKMPQGGSITFASLLPLMIYCAMFGTRRGVVVCLIYGVLQAIQDPWIIHPMQFLLDYPLAFGMVGISGIFIERNVFKGKKVLGFALGAVIAVLLRYFCHVCSGVFAFASYAGEGYTAVAWGFLYNAFAFLDMLVAMVAGVCLFASKTFTKQMEMSATGKEKVVVEIENDDDDVTPVIFEKENLETK